MTAQPPAWLTPGVHLAWLSRDIVTLNVKTDTYGLMTDAAHLVQPGPDRRILAANADVLSALVEAGLITLDVQDAITTPRACLPEIALAPGETARSPIGSRLAAAISALAATAHFHRSSLHHLLQASQKPRRFWPQANRPPLAEAYSAFDAVSPWIPWEGQCLQRAFLLREHLLQCGHPAQWILGVRTWPFLAHAWVQVGPCVVGDSLERVRTFNPILVV